MKLGVEVFSGSRGLGLSDAALEAVDEELKRLVGVSGAIIGDESVQRNAFRCLITQAWDRSKCTHELSYVHEVESRKHGNGSLSLIGKFVRMPPNKRKTENRGDLVQEEVS